MLPVYAFLYPVNVNSKLFNRGLVQVYLGRQFRNFLLLIPFKFVIVLNPGNNWTVADIVNGVSTD